MRVLIFEGPSVGAKAEAVEIHHHWNSLVKLHLGGPVIEVETL
jgi:hypothetical protein